MNTKIINAIKATAIVLGFCCAALLTVLLVVLARAAKSLFLMLLAIVAPFAALGLAVMLVYKYLESK